MIYRTDEQENFSPMNMLAGLAATQRQANPLAGLMMAQAAQGGAVSPLAALAVAQGLPGATVNNGISNTAIQGQASPGGRGRGRGQVGPAPDWLIYANQNKVRNDPLSPELIAAMGFLPEMGISMEVFSGGQENNTTHGLGSTRHNDGSAADVMFYRDGKPLDWRNPADIPIYQEIVRRAKAAGLTGFGAGPGYMAPGSMHIGYGAPAVWGDNGSSANAPAWLREAYYR